MPVINNQTTAVTDQDETGAILYVSNKSIENTEVNGYFMYKRDSYGDLAMRSASEGETYTPGVMIAGNPAEHWKYSVV